MTTNQEKLSNDSFSRLADHLPEIVVRYDLEGKRIYVNKAYERFTGNSAAEVIGTDLTYKWAPETPVNVYQSHLERTLKTGELQQFPLQLTTPTGKKTYHQVTLLAERDEKNRITGAIGISYDITPVVETRRTLRDNTAKYHALIEGANDGISVQELDENDVPGPFIEVNEALCRRLGYSKQELLKMGPQEITPQEYQNDLRGVLPHLLQEGAALFESVQLTRDGKNIPVEISVRLLPLKGRRLLFAIARDTTLRKHTEQELRRINRFLRTLSSCNEALIHATEESELLQQMCRIAVDNGEFLLAWIGYKSDDGHIQVVASHGTHAEKFLAEEITVSDTSTGKAQRPAIDAIEYGDIQIVQDISTSNTPQDWQESALKYGFGSAISLPLKIEEQIIGSLNIYLAEIDGFDSQVVALLSELTDDIAFGIQTLRLRADRELYMERLQASMASTIQALSNTVELRDPYTAGHQRHVAKLAAAVARQMGYSKEKEQVVYMGGMVHDIGKIAVPSEILSRPGKLTESEMDLARTHAEAGYEVLKSVDFPWPIANIVRQHHERLDGSGYPQGLKGEEILPEARILAVCDVVEAMTTHRPYRPGLGIDVALAEIERGKGTLYDTSVVDACTQIIRDGFSFD